MPMESRRAGTNQRPRLDWRGCGDGAGASGGFVAPARLDLRWRCLLMCSRFGPGSLAQDDVPVGQTAGERFRRAIRPDNVNSLQGAHRPKPEVRAWIIAGEITVAGLN